MIEFTIIIGFISCGTLFFLAGVGLMRSRIIELEAYAKDLKDSIRLQNKIREGHEEVIHRLKGLLENSIKIIERTYGGEII
jgi:hypothetical protein